MASFAASLRQRELRAIQAQKAGGSSSFLTSAEKAKNLEQEGRDALGRGDAPSAVRLFGAALYLQPSNDTLFGARAEAHLACCDFQSAVLNLRRALKLSREEAEAAEAQQQQQQQQQQPAGEAAAAAAAAFRRAASHAARLARVLDLRAVSLLEDGAHEEAEPLLTEAISLDSSLRELYLHRALANTALEKYEDALRDLSKCVAMDDADADVHFLRAKLSLLVGDLPAARRAADRALALEPGHPEALELQGTMGECAAVYKDEATKLLLLGSPSDAISNLTHAMALQPEDPELQVRRGAARRQSGLLYEAVRDFEAAIKKAGGKHAHGQRLLMLTFNDLGVKLATARRYPDALGWFDRAIGSDDSMGPLYLNRGDCHRSLGSIAEALSDFERAAELFAGDAKAQWQIQSRIALVHNERGTQLFNHAAVRHAAVEFSRAIECNPRVAHFYVNRAMSTMQLGRYELARDDLLTALRLSPNNERAQRLIAQLSPGDA